jgi:hypothetical protein
MVSQQEEASAMIEQRSYGIAWVEHDLSLAHFAMQGLVTK